jgi:hypothetical protein
MYVLFIQEDQKSLCAWWLQYRKLQVMFKVSPASLQTFIDAPNCVLEDRVQYSTVHIPNLFCDGHLQIINCVGIVRIRWIFHQVHRDFLITLYITQSKISPSKGKGTPLLNSKPQHKDVWESGGILPCVINICTRLNVNDQLHAVDAMAPGERYTGI